MICLNSAEVNYNKGRRKKERLNAEETNATNAKSENHLGFTYRRSVVR